LRECEFLRRLRKSVLGRAEQPLISFFRELSKDKQALAVGGNVAACVVMLCA